MKVMMRWQDDGLYIRKSDVIGYFNGCLDDIDINSHLPADQKAVAKTVIRTMRDSLLETTPDE